MYRCFRSGWLLVWSLMLSRAGLCCWHNSCQPRYLSQVLLFFCWNSNNIRLFYASLLPWLNCWENSISFHFGQTTYRLWQYRNYRNSKYIYSSRPAIAEHCAVFAVIIVFISGAFHPAGETFAIGCAVVIISFVLKGSTYHSAFWIIKIIGSIDLLPAGFLRCDADRSTLLFDISCRLYRDCIHGAACCHK